MEPAEAMNIITLGSLQILVYCDKVSSWVLPLKAGGGLAEFNPPSSTSSAGHPPILNHRWVD